MLRKLALWALVVLFLVGLFYRDEIVYGVAQGTGQVQILLNVDDVADVLAGPDLPDSLKQRIRLIQEIKQFGVDSLGLNPSDNYTTFYDQRGKPILWVITASERYKLEAKEWKFPVIGAFAYKGFFDEKRAIRTDAELRREGYDTEMNQVSAWSTLGYLKDPILSSMLYRSEGSLANLILHELTHGTLFVKDNLELNENLASFVGNLGAVRFLNQKYGAGSEELSSYEYSKRYNDAYAQHVLRGAGQLDSLYATFKNRNRDPYKDLLKERLIGQIMRSADTLLAGSATFRKQETELPNNAYFIGYQTYKSKQNDFQKEFETKFGRNFKQYLTHLKQKYPSL